ncbi:C-C motif chemokine 20-like [Hippoglossus hippoglossus]|uniref:C-C motif chemokine 20-like n=1 Tax=Hippoglossus hippoglossus TaxID=8267 RepID=UPI00148B9579|nr:C-C motif chemokine 20-like [Hippoglossus hippoglossus]XP_047197346.1 C-C motif chemokine 20-like [Hippoglossus stenolepis]
MASRLAAALLVLGLICTGFAGAEVAVDCCLSTTDKFFPLIRISTYTLQQAGEGCDISATVFITKTKNTICIVHPSESHKKNKWVKAHIEHLDKNRKAQK